MKQLHIVESLSTRAGGTPVAAAKFSEAVSRAGFEVDLFPIRRSQEELVLDGTNARLRALTHLAGGAFRAARRLQVLLTSEAYEYVHIHGLWTPTLAAAAILAKKKDIPYAISPHGCLATWALEHKTTKKRLALTLYQRQILREAKLVFATSKGECADVRAAGVDTAVAVLPLGVDLPSYVARGAQSGVKRALFLSRFHPVKGIETLLTAWAETKPKGWKLILAGEGEPSYERALRSRARALDLNGLVEFHGAVFGSQKESLFDCADLLILPSYSENFGLVIAEALIRGVPVITTKRTPWIMLEQASCGWYIEPTVGELTAAINAAVALPSERLKEMGLRGAELVKARFSWGEIGNAAVNAYMWSLGRGAEPPCINAV